jgi:hypothetical protein
VHKIIAKLARFAVSKAAAFCYAVAVGVAGNLALNFVQQHHSPAVVATAVKPADGVAVPQQPAGQPVATAPILPDPAAPPLPGPDALPAPALKPAALPPPDPAVHHDKPAAMPDAAAGGKPAAKPEPPPPASAPTAIAAVPPPAISDVPAAVSLPPIGKPIEVSLPPAPPTAPPPDVTVAAPSRESAAAVPAKSDSLALSDLWHPTRAVAKGIHWAGEQLPVTGGDADKPRATQPAIPAPISLLPRTATAPAAPGRPGPGSGGLY